MFHKCTIYLGTFVPKYVLWIFCDKKGEMNFVVTARFTAKCHFNRTNLNRALDNI